MLDRQTESAWWALKIALGLGPLLVGLDKFFNVLVNWEMYISPVAHRVLPVSATTFMYAVGVIEMAVGAAILTNWARVGGYAAMLWLVAIALNLVSMGRFYDIAARDLLIAAGAFSLARMSEARQSAGSATIPEPVEINAPRQRAA